MSALTLLAAGPFPQRQRAAYARALGSEAFVVSARAGRELDAIWHPANGTFFASAHPSVATIHDAVPFRYPDPDPKRRDHAQRPFLRSARTAARIIAVSAFGRDEVHSLLNVPLERIDVVPHGVDASFEPGKAEPLPPQLSGRPFLFFVGDPIGEPRKNFPCCTKRFGERGRAATGRLLAIAGPRSPQLPGVIHAGNLGDDLTAGRQRIATRMLPRRARPRTRLVSRNVRHANARSNGLRNAGRGFARKLAARGRRRRRTLRATRRRRCVGCGAAAHRRRRRDCAIGYATPECGRRSTSTGSAASSSMWQSFTRSCGDRARRRRVELARRSARNRPLSARDPTRLVGARPPSGRGDTDRSGMAHLDGRSDDTCAKSKVGHIAWYRGVFTRRAGLDALWFPFNGCSWTSFALPAIATLHDASNFVVPDYAPATQVIFRAAAQRCRALITDSRFAQRELARELRDFTPTIGADSAGRQPATASRFGRARRSGIGALRALRRDGRVAQGIRHAARQRWRSVARERPEVALVATTQLDGWELPSGVRVTAVGHVDDDTLAALYRGSACAGLSLAHEGFGLPVLEAMSYGTPVIASSASAVPEAGGERGLLRSAGRRYGTRDRNSTESPEMRPTRPNCAGADPLHAAAFTWETTASLTLATSRVRSKVRCRDPFGHGPTRTRGTTLDGGIAATRIICSRYGTSPEDGSSPASCSPRPSSAKSSRRRRLHVKAGDVAYVSESYDGATHYLNVTFIVTPTGASFDVACPERSRRAPDDRGEDDHVVGVEWVPIAEVGDRIVVAVVREPLLAYLRGELPRRYAGFHRAGITIEWPPGSK